MKLGAHPMVVAVAFGLLSPLALAEEVIGGERCSAPVRTACEGCTCGAPEGAGGASESDAWMDDWSDSSKLVDESSLDAAFEAMRR